MEENNKEDIERIKKLFESGQNIGAIFTSDIDRLIEEHKNLFTDVEEAYINKLKLKQLGSDILGILYGNIHPLLWSEFLMLMSRHTELMANEAIRIRKESDKGEI